MMRQLLDQWLSWLFIKCITTCIFEVQYGATVSGLTNSQIETLLETRPKRIKLKWSTSLIKDLETIRLLNFDCDIAIDANESLTKPSFYN